MKNIIKKIVSVISGAIIFELLCTGTEYILFKYLKVEVLLHQLLFENFLKNLCIYICILILIFIIHLIFNYLIIRKLNSKLKILKKKGGDYNEKK